MELLDGEPYQDDLNAIVFEKVEEFQYLGVLLNIENDWSREIGMRIPKAESSRLHSPNSSNPKLYLRKQNSDCTRR